MTIRLNAGTILSAIFGLVFMFIGAVNTFWGNDPFFGIMIVFLSLLYFQPVTDKIKSLTGIRISPVVLVILGFLILWAALGVGELYDKISLMLTDLRN